MEKGNVVPDAVRTAKPEVWFGLVPEHGEDTGADSGEAVRALFRERGRLAPTLQTATLRWIMWTISFGLVKAVQGLRDLDARRRGDALLPEADPRNASAYAWMGGV